MRQLAYFNGLLLMLALNGLVSAQSPVDEQAAVSARVASYLDAFNRRDLDACVEHWSKTAEYVVPGAAKRIQGQTAIREALGELLKTGEQFQLSVSDQRFRVVSQNTVLEEGTATLMSASHGLEQARYLVVHVQQDGQWYRDSVRETAVAPSSGETTLSDLKWLLGHWKHEHEDGSTEIHGEWIHNQRFISRSFKIRRNQQDELSGTQIIGWDPSAGVIRSWTFDSQGAFQQGVWHRDGERWLVKVSAVLPDGSVGSEQRVISAKDDNTLTIEVIEQQVQGQLLRAPEKVTLVRHVAE